MKETAFLQIIRIVFGELINGKTKAGVWMVVLMSIYLKLGHGIDLGFVGFEILPNEAKIAVTGAGATITIGLLHDAWKKLKVIILGISSHLNG